MASMTDGAEPSTEQLRAMAAAGELTASWLREAGVDHELIAGDDELVEIVELLLDIGIGVDEMLENDLTFLAGPRLIRPDATIEPSDVFRDAGAAFRAKAAIALGFNVDEDTRLLTPAEVETIDFFDDMRELLGDEDLLALMRVMGSSMARLARSVISALRLHLETPIFEESGSLAEVARAYRALTEETMTPFLAAASSVLRRHISVATAVPKIWNVDGGNAATMEQLTVGFVDMVGFTSFTEQANLKQFVDALTAFESQAQEVIVKNGGTLVKLIGDEVMFVAPTPASGVEIARRLAKLSLADGGPVSVRVGLASGEVVAVGGDYYGTVVNVASRAVGHAEPDTIVATASVANGAHASARFDSIGPRELRGISEPVELFQLL